MDMKKSTGKFVYKNKESMKKMHAFYDKAMDSLNIEYKEKYISTAYGETHIIFAGDESKPPIFTVHGGNGITPINIQLFLPLLKNYRIIAPDVIGMPGKSAPYRVLDTNSSDFGLWLCEILDSLDIEKIPFVVSSYSSAMLLSLANAAPERIEKAALVVPSGITHGPLMPIIKSMTLPMMKYYYSPSRASLEKILEIMSSQNDNDLYVEFFDLMMSSYKMEMRPPKEYNRKELEQFVSPVIIFASNDDIFFPAYKVFPKAKALFINRPKLCLIGGNHLPSDKTMTKVCSRIVRFFDTESR